MPSLPHLRELQATCDYLLTIERDLVAFPPDLAALDIKIKAASKRKAELDKAVTEGRTQVEKLTKELGLAQRLEGHAREALKGTTQKVQYAAAVRDLDHRERERGALAKPLKELEVALVSHEQELGEISIELAAFKTQFDELHQIFLSEHETQVAARAQLASKRKELEAQMAAADLGRFQRLLQQRAGRAVVAVEGGICTGCRTKLRNPVLSALREARTVLSCESCQRILFLP